MDFPGQGTMNGLAAAAGGRADQVRLARAAEKAAQQPEPKTAAEREALKESAREFEAVFLNTLMKAMRQTIPVNELFNGGGATKFYRQMHDAEIAKSLATGQAGMGIADMIVRQLSRETEEEAGGIVPRSPAMGPPAPRALSRYRNLMPQSSPSESRDRLARLAAGQGAAVADTLKRFGPEIENAADGAGLDPALILSVVMEESGGDAGARSHRGALGLMQLMPDTARELGVRDATDPAQNLHGGARYLADMLEKFAGRLDVALAAYNAGPGTVARKGNQIPDYPETRRYVKRVMERYEQLGGGTPLASPDR